MQNATHMGMNRTGAKMSPIDVSRMEEAAMNAPETEPDGTSITMMRSEAIAEADRVGSVPIPGTVRGVVSTGVSKLKGEKPEVLIDKLGERLAFERTGTRLYEALIAKCEMTPDQGLVPPLADLRRIHDEEAQHFQMLVEAMESLGADPTAQTPSADVSAVMSQGIMQVITDPRTTIPQSLNAILVAELADNASWELLIQLADKGGHEELATRFRTALADEEQHLLSVKQWLAAAVASEAL